MKLGLENFLEKSLNNSINTSQFKKKRMALLSHPASTNRNLVLSLDILAKHKNISLSSLFSPQHGLYGEKQDNMVESKSFRHKKWNIPVFSLYDESSKRRLSPLMLDQFDVIILDLQDIGCRVYTFLTTLFYILEDATKHKKEVWIFDRPNPVGRPIEGIFLNKNFHSFVGIAPLPLRHGLTLGEAALWYKNLKNLNVTLTIYPMKNYKMEMSPDYGWPDKELPWINPSPNIPRLSSARVFSGTVLLEGTNLSEGRGTTRPLEVFGAPDINSEKILKAMYDLTSNYALASKWFHGSLIRPCFFEPSFHKHQQKLCSGLQIHVDHCFYKHKQFKPVRLVSLYLKALRKLYPDYDLWRSPPYEYEYKKSPIDLISGSHELREWVDDPKSKLRDWDEKLLEDEKKWKKQRKDFLLY